MKKSATERWERLGLLEGLIDEQREKVANALEYTLKFLNNKKNHKPILSGDFETLIFPTIYRIVSKVDLTKDNIIDLINQCKSEYDDFNNAENKVLFLKTKFNITPISEDYEAEFCAAFSDKIVEEYSLV